MYHLNTKAVMGKKLKIIIFIGRFKKQSKTYKTIESSAAVCAQLGKYSKNKIKWKRNKKTYGKYSHK